MLALALLRSQAWKQEETLSLAQQEQGQEQGQQEQEQGGQGQGQGQLRACCLCFGQQTAWRHPPTRVALQAWPAGLPREESSPRRCLGWAWEEACPGCSSERQQRKMKRRQPLILKRYYPPIAASPPAFWQGLRCPCHPEV